MNILTNEAGTVNEQHIKSKGFKVFDEIIGSDMGQYEYSLPQYRNDKCTITGGYWNWKIKNNNDVVLFSGWWNSNKEFDETINKLNLL